MRVISIILFCILSTSSFGKSDFKTCYDYLTNVAKNKADRRHVSQQEGSKVNIFKTCLKAKPGFVECQEIVENAYGNNRFYIPVCLKANSGVSDCIETYRKNFSHPAGTYQGENGLDSVVNICVGETKVNNELTIEWSDSRSKNFNY